MRVRIVVLTEAPCRANLLNLEPTPRSGEANFQNQKVTADKNKDQ